MYTQKKPIDNTHIVRERDRQRNRELAAVLFLGAPIVGIMKVVCDNVTALRGAARLLGG